MKTIKKIKKPALYLLVGAVTVTAALILYKGYSAPDEGGAEKIEASIEEAPKNWKEAAAQMGLSEEEYSKKMVEIMAKAFRNEELSEEEEKMLREEMKRSNRSMKKYMEKNSFSISDVEIK